MKCIGNYFKTTAAVLCGTILLSGCSLFETKDVVTEYETENYNKNIYQASLYAEDLCVTEGNVEMTGAPDASGLHAAALFDVNGGEVDFAYQVFDKLYPASTTKIMTALVAILYGDLSEEVTVSEAASASSFAADESVAELQQGDVLTLKETGSAVWSFALLRKRCRSGDCGDSQRKCGRFCRSDERRSQKTDGNTDTF